MGWYYIEWILLGKAHTLFSMATNYFFQRPFCSSGHFWQKRLIEKGSRGGLKSTSMSGTVLGAAVVGCHSNGFGEDAKMLTLPFHPMGLPPLAFMAIGLFSLFLSLLVHWLRPTLSLSISLFSIFGPGILNKAGSRRNNLRPNPPLCSLSIDGIIALASLRGI